MAVELGQAYVQIIPSARGITGSITEAIGGEATSAGKSAGLNIVGAIKNAIAAAGIGVALKQTLDAGGALQQSFGGLDTIYGDASAAAKEYAKTAAQAGISANSYAEQAVSFGASLKQAFAGDTTKAVEAANTAIMDMADNSAKMGTDITSIQNAYQGFAKGNYTMLDNLKLGFGGTKTEMQRLLDTASAMPEAMGKTFDINNLGDVYEAIHLIQQDLGLTGVAADEAKDTFTGSMGAMKAAAENLMANLALGEDIEEPLRVLVGNAQTFLTNNMLPMVANVLKGLPTLLSGVASALIQSLNMVTNNADEIVKFALDFVVQLASAIIEVAPYLIEAAFALVKALGEALINTDWIQIGTDLITQIRDSMDLAAGEIFGSDTNIIDSVLNSITNGLPGVLDKGIEIITNVVNGILTGLPQIITMAGELMTSFSTSMISMFPVIMQKGMELVLNLVNGIISNLPQIAASVAQITASFIATIAANLPQILAQGITILGKLVAGLIQAIPTLVAAIPQIIQAIVNAFGQYDWPSIGRNILEGIKNGILSAVSSVVEAAKSAASAIWESVKSFFDMHSPSKLMAYGGEMIDAGLAQGIIENKGMIEKAVDGVNVATASAFNLNPSYDYAQPENDSKMDLLLAMLGTYLPEIAEKQGVDIQQLYNGINRQLGWALT